MLMFLFTFLFAVGCTSTKTVVCDLSKSVSSLVAAQISTQLTCKNLDAVKASIDAELAKTKLCDATPVAAAALVKPQSVIGDAVCGPVIDGLTAGVLTQVPASWGCAGGPLTDSVKAQLLAACQKAI